VRLLVTTSQSLLLLDTESGEAIPLDRGKGLYYGMARHDDRIYVAARMRQVASDVAQQHERGEILIFDRELQACGTLCAPFPLRDLHEIAWHNGTLWATCSFDNMIAIFDGERWEQWFPLGVPADGPSDVNHFNSLMFDHDRVWVLAHNRGGSELLAFSLTGRVLQQRVALGQCSHNIWREEGMLFTCSSADGKLLGENGFVLDTGGFPRGVAFEECRRYVGISELAERKDRDLSMGKIMVFDGDWAFLKQISLPGEGLVLDLLRLPDGFGPRQEKNPGRMTRWLRRLGFRIET
jgi:hypothetical protein